MKRLHRMAQLFAGAGLPLLFVLATAANLSTQPWQRLTLLSGQDARSVISDTQCPQDMLYFSLRQNYRGSHIVLPRDDLMPLRHLKWHAQVPGRVETHAPRAALNEREERWLSEAYAVERHEYKPRACYPYGWMYDEVGAARSIFLVLPKDGKAQQSTALHFVDGIQGAWLVPDDALLALRPAHD